jgi:hypothetical protein
MRWIIRAIKIRSTHFLGQKLKSEVPSRNILRQIKKSLAGMNKNTSQGLIHPFLLFATDYSADMIARELWWTNQDFSSVGITPPWFSTLIYHVGDEQ